MNQFTVLAAVLIATTLVPGADEAGNKKAEVEWAKGVVTDFLKAMKAEQLRQARRLLTPELRKEYNKDDNSLPVGRGFSMFSWVRPISWEFSKDAIATIAPDKGEVVLKGIIYGKIDNEKGEVKFTVRVIKVKDSGLWRIDYLLVEDKDSPTGPKKK